MQNVDQIIHARWVIPADDQNTVLNHHAVIINAGKIIAISPSNQVNSHYQASSEYTLNEHALMPGLINTHTHSPMTLFRGLADDLALMEWLNEHIWPAEQRLMDENFIRDGMLLSAAEMIRSGTTCFNEHYFFPAKTFAITKDIGMRATIGLIAMSVPNDYACDEQMYLDKAQATLDAIPPTDLIQYSYAPHAPYTCSNDLLTEIRQRSERDRCPIHMHMHESAPEIEGSIKEFGVRPLRRLADLKLLSPRFLNVHMTQINDEDMEILKDTRAHIAHCPESNLKLASGYAPIQRFIDAGLNVSLGTDGAASNNDLDMIGEMRTAAFIGKTIANDPTALSANNVLKMATRNGAKALGLENVTGQLKPGLAADMIAIDLSAINTQPCYNPIAQIVYAANSRQVSDVWVAGQQLLKSGRLTTIDEQEVLAIAKRWQKEVTNTLHVTA